MAPIKAVKDFFKNTTIICEDSCHCLKATGAGKRPYMNIFIPFCPMNKLWKMGK